MTEAWFVAMFIFPGKFPTVIYHDAIFTLFLVFYPFMANSI